LKDKCELPLYFFFTFFLATWVDKGYKCGVYVIFYIYIQKKLFKLNISI